MPIIRRADVTRDEAGPAHLARGFGPYEARLHSDDGGLTQFGAFTERLPPGSRSGAAHWHEAEDEMIYVLSGTVRVHEGAETEDLGPGDAAAFPAGRAVGHYLSNPHADDALYLVVGTRADADIVHLTEEDAILHRTGDERRWTDNAGRDVDR